MRTYKNITFIGILVVLLWPYVATATMYLLPDGGSYSQEPGQRVVINIGGPTPVLNPDGGEWSVPVQDVQKVYAPTPAGAADGDVTNKEQFLGSDPYSVPVTPGELAGVPLPTNILSDAIEAGGPSPNDYVGHVKNGKRITGVIIGPGGHWDLDVLLENDHDFVCLGNTDPFAGGCIVVSIRHENGFVYFTVANFIYENVEDVDSPLPQRNNEAFNQSIATNIGAWETNGLAQDFQAAINSKPYAGTSAGTSKGVADWIGTNAKAVGAAISGSISGGSSLSKTDGSGSGADTRQSGQLAGIQKTLNDIDDKLKPDDTPAPGVPSQSQAAFNTDIEHPEETDFNSTLESIKNIGIPGNPFSSAGVTIANADAHLRGQITILGMTETIDIDFSQFDEYYRMAGSLMYFLCTLSAIFIAFKK